MNKEIRIEYKITPIGFSAFIVYRDSERYTITSIKDEFIYTNNSRDVITLKVL